MVEEDKSETILPKSDMSLVELQEVVEKRIHPEQRVTIVSQTLGSIMYALAKHLTKIAGYNVASTVLQREIRELGRKDAEKFVKLLGVKEKTLKNASQLLRTAAIILGLELKPKDGHSIVVDCPFAYVQVQPLICKICLEYNKGVLEGFAGPKFKFTKLKGLAEGDGYCEFETTEQKQ